jgi:hypothetical protein
MKIRITKGERDDRIEMRRGDGSVARTTFPKKGPVPHDVVHLLVESELGIVHGFWGLIAGGAEPDDVQDMAKAAGHASASRAEVPAAHFVPAIQAERIVECFEADLWSGGTDNGSVRDLARAGCEQSLVPCPDLADGSIDRIRTRLAAFRDGWAALATGGAVEFEWPSATQQAVT